MKGLDPARDTGMVGGAACLAVLRTSVQTWEERKDQCMPGSLNQDQKVLTVRSVSPCRRQKIIIFFSLPLKGSDGQSEKKLELKSRWAFWLTTYYSLTKPNAQIELLWRYAHPSHVLTLM